jgi:hypothetical protein
MGGGKKYKNKKPVLVHDSSLLLNDKFTMPFQIRPVNFVSGLLNLDP